MGNHHDHGHHHHHTANKKVLLWSFITIFIFMIVEALGGYWTNSLALLSDAGHMLSDAAALGLSLLAFKMGEKKANAEKTFGYKRFEIIAALINGITLIVISMIIFYEAYHRFVKPPEVSSSMMIIASVGLVVNIIVFLMLTKGDSKDNLNIRSALVHVMGDLLGSAGAILAGLLIFFFQFNIADPIASVIVSILILVSGYRVTKDAFHVLMEGKPEHVDMEQMKAMLAELEGVYSIHDLHVWSITNEFPAMTCHLVVQNEVDRDALLQVATDKILHTFHISHCTVQIEGRDTDIHDTCDNCKS
ncbi:cation diffusion facilitator family transporter [Virgibacillus halophilus]|uniref:Cation diffusion facilitator family transporter n=1 Tax=Tigheibacillus halophilus TaxID=361280 RepID=A0ABU5CA66_9BACI|nr:cation diffusion facilitator family transporter [Virgibacillus halophilus]